MHSCERVDGRGRVSGLGLGTARAAAGGPPIAGGGARVQGAISAAWSRELRAARARRQINRCFAPTHLSLVSERLHARHDIRVAERQQDLRAGERRWGGPRLSVAFGAFPGAQTSPRDEIPQRSGYKWHSHPARKRRLHPRARSGRSHKRGMARNAAPRGGAMEAHLGLQLRRLALAPRHARDIDLLDHIVLPIVHIPDLDGLAKRALPEDLSFSILLHSTHSLPGKRGGVAMIWTQP